MDKIKELQNLINQNLVCNEKTYWKLKHLPKDRWDIEIISHSSRHLSKSSGKLASICEKYEHEENFDSKEVKDILFSSLITILKLSTMLNISSEDLIQGVYNKIESAK